MKAHFFKLYLVIVCSFLPLLAEEQNAINCDAQKKEIAITDLKEKLNQQVEKQNQQIAKQNQQIAKQNQQIQEQSNNIERFDRYYLKEGDNYHDIKEQILHHNNQTLDNVRNDNDCTLGVIVLVVTLLTGGLGILSPLHFNNKTQRKNEELISNAKKDFSEEHKRIDNEITNIKALNKEIIAFNEEVMINGNFQLAFLQTDLNEKISLYESFIHQIIVIIDSLRKNFQEGIKADNIHDIEQLRIEKYTSILATSYTNLAKTYIEIQDYSSALDAYNKAISINGTNANLYNERGNVYSGSGDLDNALSNYNKALEINSKFGFCYLHRAQLYEKREKYDKAVHDYTEALKNGVSGKIVFSKRAYSKVLSNDIEGAIEDYSNALEEDSFDYAAYCNRGAARVQLIAKMQNDNTAGKDEKIKTLIEQCFADYNQALLLKPNYTPAIKNKANIFALLGEYEKAVELYNAMIEVTPNDASLYFNLGSLQLTHRKFKESELNLLKAQKLTPRDPENHSLLSRLYKDMSNDPAFADKSGELIKKSDEHNNLYFLNIGLNQTKNIETQ